LNEQKQQQETEKKQTDYTY